MPFKSKAQARAAFGGYLGPEMKSKAPEFAHATKNMKTLPAHVGKAIKHDHTMREVTAHLTGKRGKK